MLGIDVDESKVNALNAGESYIKHIPAAEVQAQCDAGQIEATTDCARVSELDAVLICVPTPLDDKREPDLIYVLNTARAIAPHLPKGIVAVLTERMNAWIAKREKESGATNPMFTNLHWHGSKTHKGPFESSQQAYDTLHIGSVGAANKLQAGNKKKN